MLQQLRTAILVLIAMTILTGGIYPLVVTAISQVVFPREANGSLIHHYGQVVGSDLIGQPFSRSEYFWGRLSATSPMPYNAAASSGSNFGLLHPGLKEAAEVRIAQLEVGISQKGSIPVELLSASGSGLDPHISPAAAELQVRRVAAARKISEEAVRTLVRQQTESRQFRILGEARVNVLRLNQSLDQLQNER